MNTQLNQREFPAFQRAKMPSCCGHGETGLAEPLSPTVSLWPELWEPSFYCGGHSPITPNSWPFQLTQKNFKIYGLCCIATSVHLQLSLSLTCFLCWICLKKRKLACYYDYCNNSLVMSTSVKTTLLLNNLLCKIIRNHSSSLEPRGQDWKIVLQQE